MTIELYSKPACVQCNQTKKTLDRMSAEYSVTDVTEDPTAYDFVTKTLGYMAAPVVVIKDAAGAVISSWSGFQPEKLQELAA